MNAAKSTVKKHYQANKTQEIANGVLNLVQPLYLSFTDYTGWLSLSASVAGGVPVFPPTVHTATIDTEDIDRIVENTWIFGWVDDASRRVQLQVGEMEKVTPQNGCSDTQTVLTNMLGLLTGTTFGHAFNNSSCTQVDPGMTLAALAVARYTRSNETLWDLCSENTLLPLPMTLVGMGRNYVCVAPNHPESYELMVHNMQNVSFLHRTCAPLYDGKWDTDTGVYSKLSVCSPHSFSSIATRAHTHTHTHTHAHKHIHTPHRHKHTHTHTHTHTLTHSHKYFNFTHTHQCRLCAPSSRLRGTWRTSTWNG